MSHTGGDTSDTPPSTYYGSPFDDSDAEIVLRSSSGVHFRVYKVILSKASRFFRWQFTLPPAEEKSGVLFLSEDTHIIAHLLTFCYPLRHPRLTNIQTILAILAAAKKYDMDGPFEQVRRQFRELSVLKDFPFKAYGIACTYKLEDEARLAAKLCLRKPIDVGHVGEDMDFIPGAAFRCLWEYHKECGRVAKDTAVADRSWIYKMDGDRWGWTSHADCECKKQKETVANGDVWKAPRWWVRYMERNGGLLETRPTGSLVQMKEHLRKAAAHALKCPACSTRALGFLEDCSERLAQEVDKRTSMVRAPFVLVYIIFDSQTANHFAGRSGVAVLNGLLRPGVAVF
ncbi:hypothetical protein DENSPDRAFT_675621 [Dentipellis sp. KUC8613]|nr:hypothetical protein DENSPDRAFT_675621 [Dentipellis sp. KUC8613]